MPLFSASSPFDSEVEKATNEVNVKEDLSVMRDICQRCQHVPNGAADLLRSIVKRLNNKVPHVAMQALTLLDVGVVYGGLSFRQEVASRDFVSECRTLITNGKTHTKVIKRLKHLIRRWAENEFKSEPSLSSIPSLFNSLRSEGHAFPIDEQAVNILPNQEDDDLARAIAMSLKESSGRSLYPSTDGFGGSSSAVTKALRQVRALYDFEAAEDNELTFKAGDLIYILDDSDSNWWKGSSTRGEGLFPANFVTADLTVEPESLQSKSRKSVRFQEEVDVQVVETAAAAEVIDIDERKIHEALSLIQNTDPSAESDAPELLLLEDQCRSMAPLIDQELEKIDRQHNTMVLLNSQLMEAFKMYHTLMPQLPVFSAPSVNVPTYQPFDGQQTTASTVPLFQNNFAQPSTQPPQMLTGFTLQASLPHVYQPGLVRSDSPQHFINLPTSANVIGPGNVL